MTISATSFDDTGGKGDAAPASSTRGCVGVAVPEFEPIRDQMDAYLLGDPSYSAQLSVYWNGELVVDLAGGPHLNRDSLTGIFSATKGIAAIALATLVQDSSLDLDARVVDYWPEFGVFGKDQVLVRELLSHQVGLLGVDGGLSIDDFSDSSVAAAKLAAARPVWIPGSAFGYHGLTIGIFMEELVRRITHGSLRELYESVVRSPRDIECWLGLPPELDARYSPLIPIRHTPATAAEAAATAMTADGVAAFAFSRFEPSPQRLVNDDSDPEMILTNHPVLRRSGFASAAGVASARGLAQAYAAALGHFGAPLLEREVVDEMSQQQVWGLDRLSSVARAFAVVFMKPVPSLDFGSLTAFGHDGAHGRLAYADPAYGLSFGYIPSPMQHVAHGAGADSRSLRFSELARHCVVSARRGRNSR